MRSRKDITKPTIVSILMLLLLTISPLIAGEKEKAAALYKKGLKHFEAGRFEQAIEYHEKALRIARANGLRTLEAKALGALGKDYHWPAETYDPIRKATEYYEKALAIYRGLDDQAGEMEIQDMLFRAYHVLGEFAKEIECLETLLDYYSNSGDEERETSIRNSIKYAREWESGGIDYIEHVSGLAGLMQEIGAKELEVAYLINIGNTYLDRNDVRGAIESFQSALKITQQENQQRDEFACLNGLARAHYESCDYHAALEYASKALDAARAEGRKIDESSALNILGEVYRDLGYLTESLNAQKMALDIASEIGDGDREAVSLLCLANSYFELLEFKSALPLYERSLEIAEQIGNREGMRANLNNLGATYCQLGDYERAIQFHKKSLAMGRNTEGEMDQAASLTELGEEYARLGDHSSAMEHQEMALSSFRDLGDKSGQSIALHRLGSAYIGLGNHIKALEALLESRALCLELDTSSESEIALGSIADILAQMGALTKTSSVCVKPIHPIPLGRCHLMWGDFIEARAQFIRRRAEAKDSQLPSRLLASYIGEGLACEGLGEIEDARDAFKKAVEILERRRDALTLSQRRKFLAGMEGFFLRIEAYEGFVRTNAKLKDTGQAFFWAENTRARVLTEQLAAKGAQSGDLRLSKELAEEEERLDLELRMNLKSQEAAFKADNKELAWKLEAEYAAIKKRQSEFIDRLRQNREYAEYAAAHYPAPIKANQVPLASDEVLIEFEVTDPMTYVFVLQKGEKIRQLAVNKSRAELETLTGAFRSAFERDASRYEFDIALAKELFDLLLKDALDGVPENTKLIVVPDECLCLLPFEALAVETDIASTAEQDRLAAQLEPVDGLVAADRIAKALLTVREWRPGPHAKLPRIGIPIEFAAYSVEVEDGAERQLAEIASALAKRGLCNSRYRVECYTDNIGETSYQKSISRSRAKTVADYLAAADGLDEARFHPVGLGGSWPVASNATVEGRAKNNRVELVRLPPEGVALSPPDASSPGMAHKTEYLIDRFASVSYWQASTVLASHRGLRAGQKRKHKKDLFALADPIFNEDDERLSGVAHGKDRLPRTEGAPMSGREVLLTARANGADFVFDRLRNTAKGAEEVGKLFRRLFFRRRVDILTGESASRAEVNQRDLKDYRYIIFATHAVLGNELPYVKEPALVLTLEPDVDERDGFLRMSDVANLRLNADLVCLTACQTGLGAQQAGEGVMGLTRAFMYAGCDSLLVSLWSVAEDSSVDLMREFFKSVKKGKKDRSEALHDAKMFLREHGYDHPFCWAPFVLVGER